MPEAGWYPDPEHADRIRWWDGTGWTEHAQSDHGGQRPAAGTVQTQVIETAPPTAPLRESSEQAPGFAASPSSPATYPAAGGRPRKGRFLLLVVAALGMLAAGGGLGYWLTTNETPQDEAVAIEAGQTDVTPADAEGSDEADAAGTEDESEERGVDAASPSAQPPPPDEEQPSAQRIRFGPGCEALVPPQDTNPKPWEYHDGQRCSTAPLPGDQTQWVAVLASLNGNDFGFDDAVRRAEDWRRQGVRDPLILWSDFYSSLNPNLWAIVDGPYPNEAAADAACSGISSSCYSRQVSSDSSARYCQAADGCVGERQH